MEAVYSVVACLCFILICVFVLMGQQISFLKKDMQRANDKIFALERDLFSTKWEVRDSKAAIERADLFKLKIDVERLKKGITSHE